MIKYSPVPLEEQSKLLGKEFANRFADEMYEYYRPFVKKDRPIQVAKEAWEYAVADSIPAGEWVGAGHSVVDVETPYMQLDVKGLSCNKIKGMTTEASVCQNHQIKHDNTYMVFFEQQNFEGLYDIYVQGLLDKIQPTTNLHVLCAVREKVAKKVYATLLKIQESELSKQEIINGMQLRGTRSVSVPLIDPKYGETYIYLPKRRLEIRLNIETMMEFSIFSHSYASDMYD